jgi:hypothetical protein
VGKPGTKGLGTPFAREQKPLRAGQGRRLLAADLTETSAPATTTSWVDGESFDVANGKLRTTAVASLGILDAPDEAGYPLTSLPFEYTNPRIGPFTMRWGFEGSPGTAKESIVLEITLPSDTYIGIGLGCNSSKACDMVVGNGGGGKPVFLTDYFEAHGDALPITDVDLGGTDDVELLSASYVDWASTIRFRRLLDTGDKWDYVLTKGPTDIVYAWCALPFCTATDTAHGPGDWDIINVDLSGRGSLRGDSNGSDVGAA